MREHAPRGTQDVARGGDHLRHNSISRLFRRCLAPLPDPAPTPPEAGSRLFQPARETHSPRSGTRS
ncbi:hypothetical protein TVNIR_2277 [Thioalkalivibrio nitratireducens DSM 14787]|uniref:Uncharacterized protein n=1 Tax=Thioalkalivibrio nitratireducens (strain DSM 14787 / UNIQEM 213 / ALEN2) TaxID=1255043 RepID=L0DWG4_THIND|nr:hypothetical protein TVNIR_2277 [Thioalkalivibrio nitratireducens DSM 14787]